MIRLYNAANGELLGELSDEQLQFLVDQFEEETSDDQDYYVNTTTLEGLKEAGADNDLVKMLERAMGEKGEADVRWSRFDGS